MCLLVRVYITESDWIELKLFRGTHIQKNGSVIELVYPNSSVPHLEIAELRRIF